jgi:PAS domain S-box-containing protein
VLDSDTQHFECGLIAAFPEDRFLTEQGYDSYLGSPMFDASGKPIGLVSVVSRRPITVDEGTIGLFEALATRAGAEVERVRALAARTESEVKFREMVDVQTEMVCRFLADGRVQFVNQAYCEMFGIRPEDIHGKPYSPLVHPDDISRVEAELARISPGRPRVTIENRVIDRDGRVRWTQWTNLGLFDEEQRLVAHQAAGRDITAQKLAEDKLRHQRQRFRFLADFSSSLVTSLELDQTLERAVRSIVPYLADSGAIALFTEDGSLRVVVECHVDPEIERHLNQDRLPARGKALVKLIDTLRNGGSVLVPDFTDAALRAMDLAPEYEDRVRMRTLRSYLLVPLMGRERSLGMLALETSRNHSDRVYDEEDLRFAQALGERAGLAIENARLFHEVLRADQQKDQFLAVLAHELRNPLAAISNALTVLELTPAGPSRDRALEIAKRQTRQQTRLLDDLLDVSRLTRSKITLKREYLVVARALRDVIDAKRDEFERRDQVLVAEIAPEDTAIHADPARFEQIVVNLLDNAGKYTPPGGKITLSAKRDRTEVVIRVSDTGEGIATTVLPGIFDMFQQGPHGESVSGGLGIGLTVVRELVRIHGGTVAAASEGPGLGSTFTVRLPIAEPVDFAVNDGMAKSREMGVSRRVLVVDDNIDAAMALEDVLRIWGHDVRCVHDGAAAVRAAVDFQPDLALIDIAMPGMDGYSTARAIRMTAVGDRIRLVALTGFGQPRDIKLSIEAKFDQHLTKPAKLETLQRLLNGLP